MLDPDRYESNKFVAARDAAEFVPKMIQMLEWTPGENILDYGCGAGSTGYNFILPQAEAFDSRIYAVDISEKMLEYARDKFSHHRITYARGEILQGLPFENVKFDKIFSIYVFHFIRDIRTSLKRFYEIMKPGASLAFTMVPKSYYHKAFRVLADHERWKDYFTGYKETTAEWMNYEDGAGRDTFSKLLSEPGFQIEHLEIQQRTYPFDDIDTFLELYMAVNSFVGNIPGDLRPQFKFDLRKAITGFAGISENSTTITSQYEFAFAIVKRPL